MVGAARQAAMSDRTGKLTFLAEAEKARRWMRAAANIVTD
jgi:hypothetical protein